MGVQAGKIMFLLNYLQTVVLTQNLVWSRVFSCSLLKLFSCSRQSMVVYLCTVSPSVVIL